MATCPVNPGEVRHSVERAVSAEQADAIVQEIRDLSIEIVNADWPLAHEEDNTCPLPF